MCHLPLLHLQTPIDVSRSILRIMVYTLEHVINIIPSRELGGFTYASFTYSLEFLQ
jgi:hypothetical protein